MNLIEKRLKSLNLFNFLYYFNLELEYQQIKYFYSEEYRLRDKLIKKIINIKFLFLK